MFFYLIISVVFLCLSCFVVYLAVDRRRIRQQDSSDDISYLDVFDAIPDIMGVQDADRRIIRYNSTGYQYLNIGPEDAIGKHCYELIGRTIPCDPCSTRDAVSTGEVTSIIKHIPSTDTWFNVRAYPIKDSRGRVVKVVEHLRDISEEKRLQLALENVNKDLENQVEKRTKALNCIIEELTDTRDHLIESEKLSALGRMVAGISHEVNTPLGIAITSASFISELISEFESPQSAVPEAEAPENHKNQDFLDQLKSVNTLLNSNLRRAGDLMGSFKKIAADQTSERLRTIQAAEYVKEFEISFFPLLARSGIATHIECESKRTITTYPGALTQIFTNLYMNSINHAFPNGEEGRIIVKVTDSSTGILMEYVDNGCGMNEEVLKRLYEPFYTSRLGSEGIGLGMYIVYNLVMGKLKGTIHCESSPGNGTRFIIGVPDLEEENSALS